MHHHRNRQPRPWPPTRDRRLRPTLALAIAAGLLSTSIATAPPASALIAFTVTTGRISVSSSGEQSDLAVSDEQIAISQDGRFVAFTTEAELQPADTNAGEDVYLRDRMAGTTTLVSLTNTGGKVGAAAKVCGMSRDARFVAFVGVGSGLVSPGDWQIHLRDRKERTTEIVSVSTGGDPSSIPGGLSGISTSQPCPVSDDGRYVAFTSGAPNLAGGDENGDGDDVFRRDLLTESTQRVSLSTVGLGGDGESRDPAMSTNGTVIAFSSVATNLVPNDTNAKQDVFVRVLDPGLTTRVSVTAGGAQLALGSTTPALSGDGNKVAFASGATNLVAGDTNGVVDVFVRDRAASTVVRASRDTDGNQITDHAKRPDISASGGTVTWAMRVPTSIPSDTNLADDVYRLGPGDSKATLVSQRQASGTKAGAAASSVHALSGDGLVVAFTSIAPDLVRNDTNGAGDAFARDFQNLLTPFISPAAFTKQQFVDFEGRQPTTAELDEWKARIDNGERTPDELIDELAHGTTWAGKRAPLSRLYWAFFLRPPDTGGMTYWTNQLTGGKKLSVVAKQFSQSSEFQTKYGSLSNQAFVTKIYQNIFSRNPDPSGLAYWTNRLTTKQKTRGDVMVSFSESSEGKRVLAPQTDTVLIYLGMLRRMPTLAITLEGIQAMRDQGYPPEVVAESVREESEYEDRVVET